MPYFTLLITAITYATLAHRGFRSRGQVGNTSFKYNQQDTTLYNILYYCQCSTCFGRFLRPPSGAEELACLLAATASVGELEKPPETCRALTVLKNIA